VTIPEDQIPPPQLETMKVTIPEKGEDDTAEMSDYENDQGIPFDTVAGKGRIPQSIADEIAKAIRWWVYAFSAGTLFYMICRGVSLLWTHR
jgi:hypothetical protein